MMIIMISGSDDENVFLPAIAINRASASSLAGSPPGQQSSSKKFSIIIKKFCNHHQKYLQSSSKKISNHHQKYLQSSPKKINNHHQKYLQSLSKIFAIIIKIFAIIIKNIIIEIFTIIVKNRCYNCQQYLQSQHTIFAVNGFEQFICTSFQRHILSQDIFFVSNICKHCQTILAIIVQQAIKNIRRQQRRLKEDQDTYQRKFVSDGRACRESSLGFLVACEGPALSQEIEPPAHLGARTGALGIRSTHELEKAAEVLGVEEVPHDAD